MLGRCMKCKKQVEIKDGKEVIVNEKRGIKGIKGNCPECNTVVFRIVPKNKEALK